MSRRNLRTGEQRLHPPAAGQAGRGSCASTGTRRSSCRTTTRASSTAGRSTSSARSTQGDDLKPISPGPDLVEARRRSRPSPRARGTPDVLWAGTDDGNVWVTQRRRREVDERDRQAARRPGCPARGGSRRIEPSRTTRRPLLRLPRRATAPTTTSRTCFVTEDFGETWKPITANLPAFGSTRVPARGHTQPERAVLRHRVRHLGVGQPRRELGEAQQQPADGRGPRGRAADDGERDRGRDARPQRVGAGRDQPPADAGADGARRRTRTRRSTR